MVRNGAPFKVGFLEKNQTRYWNSINTGIERGGTVFGFETLVRAPEHEDVDLQIAHGRDLLREGVDALGVVGTRSGPLSDFVDEVVESGLPVVTFDLDLPDTRRHLYVGSADYARLGQVAAESMAESLSAGDPVLVMPGSSIGQGAKAKVAGFCAEMERKGIEVVVGESDEDDAGRCAEIAARLIETRDFRGLFGPYAYHPHTFARLVTERDLSPRPVIVGFDMEEETVQAIQQGLVASSIWIREYYFGLYACSAIGLMLNHGLSEALEFLGRSGTDFRQNRIVVPSRTFERSNVHEFIEWQRRLGFIASGDERRDTEE